MTERRWTIFRLLGALGQGVRLVLLCLLACAMWGLLALACLGEKLCKR